jgi:hypothetical protein
MLFYSERSCISYLPDPKPEDFQPATLDADVASMIVKFIRVSIYYTNYKHG